MTNEKKPSGAISVEMGNNNTIGHIGHITYYEPAPGPNSILQQGKVVGKFEGQPRQDGMNFEFPALAFDAAIYDPRQIIEIQGVKLKIVDYAVSGSVQTPLKHEEFLKQVFCTAVPD